MLEISTDNCKLLKKEGNIMVRVPLFCSIPLQEIAIKLKGTEGHRGDAGR